MNAVTRRRCETFRFRGGLLSEVTLRILNGDV